MLKASVKQDIYKQQATVTTGICFRSVKLTQRLNADELGNSAGVRVMRGMPFACMLRAGNHPLPISATAKSGWMIADYGLPILEMATLSHNATILS